MKNELFEVKRFKKKKKKKNANIGPEKKPKSNNMTNIYIYFKI